MNFNINFHYKTCELLDFPFLNCTNKSGIPIIFTINPNGKKATAPVAHQISFSPIPLMETIIAKNDANKPKIKNENPRATFEYVETLRLFFKY